MALKKLKVAIIVLCTVIAALLTLLIVTELFV